MVAYLAEARRLLGLFHSCTIKKVSHSQNANADAQARLVSTKDAQLLDVILVEYLSKMSIEEK